MTRQRRNWTREETLEALALYLRTPFGRLHARNPEIIALAERLGRTPAAVALKACNFAALDDSLPRTPQETERIVAVRQRLGQDFFRRMVTGSGLNKSDAPVWRGIS